MAVPARNITIIASNASKRLPDGITSYVYDPVKPEPPGLAKLLAACDASAARFLNPGHPYLEATRWANSRELVVVLYGHFDDPPSGGSHFNIGLTWMGVATRFRSSRERRSLISVGMTRIASKWTISREIGHLPLAGQRRGYGKSGLRGFHLGR
jgi:hypothetical protein